MSNFSLSVAGTGSPVVSIVMADWVDDVPSLYQRLNVPRQPKRYQRINGAALGYPFTLAFSATIGGILEPTDASLGVTPSFLWWWSQKGMGPQPPINPVAGSSSRALVVFQASNLGTWVITAYRIDGGAVRMGVSIEED